MTDYSSLTPQDFSVTDLTGGPDYTNGLVNTGGNGTLASPYAWSAASTTSTGHFSLHYWRSGSTNNWGHVTRSDITTSISGTTVTVKLSNVDQFTFDETDAFVSSGGGTSTEGLSYSGELIFVPSVPSLAYTIPQSSATGTYTIYSYDAGTASLQETINHSTTSSVGSIGGVSNFDSGNTHKLLSPLGQVLDTYTPGGVKKVHCNFW